MPVGRCAHQRRATGSVSAIDWHPGLQRPPMHIAPALSACGDFVDGPYPATLEGAVRSAQAAVAALVPPKTPTYLP